MKIYLTIFGLILFASQALAFDKKHLDNLIFFGSCPGCDLAGADLSGMDLTKADLSGSNLKGANLTDADLSEANFSNADLSKAKLAPQVCIILSLLKQIFGVLISRRLLCPVDAEEIIVTLQYLLHILITQT